MGRVITIIPLIAKQKIHQKREGPNYTAFDSLSLAMEWSFNILLIHISSMPLGVCK